MDNNNSPHIVRMPHSAVNSDQIRIDQGFSKKYFLKNNILYIL